ncbi:MAG: photosystem I assembly protein Ycf4 [Synechococcales cyanobacterium T60_A2020_003]|nr:photosystem I assembly protein Ycf4 [Synechococcales cyanobacterium T60_A2020_003]
MSSSTTKKTADLTLTQDVLGSRRFSNYWWATVVLGGSLGFLLASLSSYFKVNLLPFASPTDLIFVPQGAVMGFYGVAGLLLATYLWSVILLDVGGGFNRFDRNTGTVTIFRKGFLGKNRTIEVSYPLEDVQAIRVEIKEGLNPRRVLYLRVKGKGDLPLTPVGQPMALSRLENQGAELARFLGVPLEGL